MRRQIIGNLGRIWQTSFVVMAWENTGDASIFPCPWKKNHSINFSTKVSIHPMPGPSTSTRPSLGRCPGPPFTGEDIVLLSENWGTNQPEPEFRAVQPPKSIRASSALIPWNRRRWPPGSYVCEACSPWGASSDFPRFSWTTWSGRPDKAWASTRRCPTWQCCFLCWWRHSLSSCHSCAPLHYLADFQGKMGKKYQQPTTFAKHKL